MLVATKNGTVQQAGVNTSSCLKVQKSDMILISPYLALLFLFSESSAILLT
jgi:hypothetical protein